MDLQRIGILGEKDFEILKTVRLFDGIGTDELPPLLGCLSARAVRFEKGQILFLRGEPSKALGVVLSGQVQVVQEDYYGNRSILGGFGPGELFGEAFACAGTQSLPVSVLAAADGSVLLLDCTRLAAPCEKACPFHSRLIGNLLRIMAQKNILLTQKIELTSRRTTREKLLAYLSAQAQRAGGSRFTIPFNRQELADYLSVDRSAMSAELCKLRDEGVLLFRKNRFELR